MAVNEQVEAIQARIAKLEAPDKDQGMVYAATVDSFQVGQPSQASED